MTEPRQMPEICPFLVAASDPDSVLNYPAAENACVKLGKPLSVSPDYQANYCLRTRHWFCPVFTGSVKQPPVPIRFEEQLLAEGVSSASPELALPITRFESLPARGVGRVRRSTPSVSRQERIPRRRRREALGAFVIVLLIGGAWYGSSRGLFAPSVITPSAALSAAPGGSATQTATWTSTPATTDTPALSETSTNSFTETAPPTVTATLTSTVTLTSTEAASATFTATSEPTATLKRCAVPTGWQPYTVAPGETYYKISVRFGTTVDALQRVNCLADPGRLLAGQTISVPAH